MSTLVAAVAAALAADGVRHAFGLVGGGNVLATAALTASGVHYTAARHEGGAMGMADAYFRATGEVAVCTTTHGPGIANTATALAEAAKNRSAVLVLSGDAPLAGPRPHDIDQTALITSLGVPVVRLTEPGTAVAHTRAALSAARVRQCPVVVLLPNDLLGAETGDGAPHTDALHTDAPHADEPHINAHRTDAHRTDAPHAEASQADAPHAEASQADAHSIDPRPTDPHHITANRSLSPPQSPSTAPSPSPSPDTAPPTSPTSLTSPTSPTPSDRETGRLAALLAGARRPLLLAGAGAWRGGAGKVLRDLGDRIGALYATTVMAHGLFDDSPWSLGICGGFSAPGPAELIGRADVVLAFGARLDTFTLHGGRLLDPAATVVRVDLSDEPAPPRVDLTVRGDAAAIAVRLLDAIDRLEGPVARAGSGAGWRTGRTRALASARWHDVPYEDAGTADRIDPRTLTRALAALLPGERTLVLDGGHFIGWPAMYWSVPDPAAMVFTGAAFQSIGLGLSGAVGAAIGRPDRVTVAALGDGGALMGLPELDTLVRTGRPCLAVVYDDGSYGFEEHMYVPRGADGSTMTFPDTDFAGLARALGAEAVTVRRAADLDAVTAWRERGCSGTLLLDCKIVRRVIAPYLADLLADG
ncbi:thiamine pyrophosphate-binding protein [Streptomyces sp. PTD5-9]|uniref:thiamine pyrophosphate-binding protein n=1 Tax=Streptomyces sp. PTD5-9 TaxID=3120150 RepID=UPI003009B6BC